jgi:hypothetical protein
MSYTDLLNLRKPNPSPPAPKAEAPAVQTLESTPSPIEPLATQVPVPNEQNVRLLESQNVSNLTSQHVRMSDFVADFLRMKNDDLLGFRYPKPLIKQLDQLEYEINMTSDKKVSKTMILVIAFGYLLWDYRRNGSESILAKLLQKQVK